MLNYSGSVEDPTKTAALATLLQTGFNGGQWNGLGGITTSKVASDMAANPATYQYLTGIGYMSGVLIGGSFLGRSVDAGSVVAVEITNCSPVQKNPTGTTRGVPSLPM